MRRELRMGCALDVEKQRIEMDFIAKVAEKKDELKITKEENF